MVRILCPLARPDVNEINFSSGVMGGRKKSPAGTASLLPLSPQERTSSGRCGSKLCAITGQYTASAAERVSRDGAPRLRACVRRSLAQL
jgi:hypothetical protein